MRRKTPPNDPPPDMTMSASEMPQGAGTTARQVVSRTTIVAAAAILILAYLLQTHFWIMNADTSWLITVVERMRGGERLYVDIIENNPPISIWLYVPPVMLAEWTGISPETATILLTLLVCLIAASLAMWIAGCGDILPRNMIAPVGLALLAVSTILSGNCFSERDHLGAVLVLPMMMLAVWRTIDMRSPRAAHWISAGLSGSAIVLVKPYYALIVIAAALYIAVRRRDWRALFLPEFLLAAIITVAYLALAWFVYPDFFTTLLPLLNEIYMSFRWPFLTLAYLCLPLLVLPFAVRSLRARGGWSELAGLLFWTSIAALIPYFIQGKGWAYHLYPAIYLASACMIVMGASIAIKAPRRAAIEAIVFTILAVTIAHGRFIPSGQGMARLAEKADGKLVGMTVGGFGGDIALGHPLTRLIGGHWIEPYCADWIATFSFRKEFLARLAGDFERVQYFSQMRSAYFAEKMRRLTAAPPQVLIVPVDDELVTMMREDYGFNAFLDRYAVFAEDTEFRIYRLKQP
jgi:hypothetical protein